MSLIQTIGIVGAGAMGRGIAQIAALAGVKVVLFDIDPHAVAEGDAFVKKMINRLAEKGKINSGAAQKAVALLSRATSLEDLAASQVIVEAVVEKLEVKQQLFNALEGIVSDDCILATNTSSLSVTAIASTCRISSRVAGLHFFNPVPLMKVVEVIQGLLTDSSICDDLSAMAKRMGHQPVRAKDTPGFIVNHAGRAYGTEAMAILEEGIAEPLAIDRILRDGSGFRMGPFELYDLTALDVSHPATVAIFEQFYQDQRYRPSYLLGQRLTAGLLGRKSKRGFYSYDSCLSADRQACAETVDTALVSPPVWVSRVNAAGYKKVATLLGTLGIEHDQGDLPAEESLCLVTPLGRDNTSSSLDQTLQPQRTLAIDTLFELDGCRTLMKNPLTPPEVVASARRLFGQDGVPVEIIKDSPGFVAQRVLAMVVNTACTIAQKGIASPEDLDLAATKGLGYPLGPLAWGDLLGPSRILQILQSMQEFYGDPRYRASPWLIRRAHLGVSLLTPEL